MKEMEETKTTKTKEGLEKERKEWLTGQYGGRARGGEGPVEKGNMERKSRKQREKTEEQRMKDRNGERKPRN